MLCIKVSSHQKKALHQFTAQVIQYGLLQYLFSLTQGSSSVYCSNLAHFLATSSLSRPASLIEISSLQTLRLSTKSPFLGTQDTYFLPLSSPLNNSLPLFIPILNIHFEHLTYQSLYFLQYSYYHLRLCPNSISSLLCSSSFSPFVYYIVHILWLIIVQHALSTHLVIPFDLAIQPLQSTQESVQSSSLLQPHPSLNHP